MTAEDAVVPPLSGDSGGIELTVDARGRDNHRERAQRSSMGTVALPDRSGEPDGGDQGAR